MFDPISPKEIEKHWQDTAQHQKMTTHRHFFVYAYHLLTNAPLYIHWQTLLSYVRKIRAIAFFFRILTLLLTVIETGALVILSTVLFLVLLPILASLMLGILLTARIDSKRVNQKMNIALEKKKVYVFFLPREDAKFLCANAQNLAQEGHGVILVSPYWIVPNGLGKGHFYFTVRQEKENLYLIRRYYFFSFRKHVLKKENTIIVY